VNREAFCRTLEMKAFVGERQRGIEQRARMLSFTQRTDQTVYEFALGLEVTAQEPWESTEESGGGVVPWKRRC
jgi:hypothetical protein